MLIILGAGAVGTAGISVGGNGGLSAMGGSTWIIHANGN